MRKTYITIFLMLFVIIGMMAQPGKVRETWSELKEKGDVLYDAGSYYTAAEYYSKALKLNSSNVELKYKQAESYRLGRNYKRAGIAYKTIRKKILRGSVKKTDYPLIDYYYGLMMKQSGDYEEAEEAFYQFIEEFDGSVDEQYKTMARNEFDGCQMARMSKESIVKVAEVDALNKKVNSKYTESSAFVMSDGTLLFSSLKSDEPIVIEGQSIVSRLFTAEIGEKNKVRNVEKFSLALPGGLFHIGSATLSPDGERIYLSICEQDGGSVSDCDIFVSQKNPGNDKYDWGRPQKMPAPINSDEFESITPFATSTSDGREVLYFASDREGGQGGMDIWVATGRDGEFTDVVNLGTKINSIGDDISPYIDDAEGYEDPRPILYFSSNGHPSYGGLDIQVAYKNNVNFTEWSETKNAGAEINSTADEFSYSLAPEKNRAYFVSNREGGYSVSGRTCCDDVFYADIAPPKLEKIIVADLSGKVFDENKKIMEGAKLTLYDVTSGRKMVKDLASGKAGFSHNPLDLERSYELEVAVNGYDSQKFSFNTKGLTDNKTIYKDFYLKKEKVIAMTCSVTGKVYGDSGSTNKSLVSGAKVKIYQFIGGKQELFKELDTDSRGEFRIDLPKENSYRVVVSKDGYLNASVSESTKGAGEVCNKNVTLTVKEKRKNVAFKIENILYDFDSPKLRDESIPNLEVLLRLLNDNPNIVIELGSHTDSKGTDEYNMALSQKRAQSVVDWLVGKGITTNRLVARGYGESAPLVPNTNPDGSDNPDNRQLNRRTEFKIIGDVNN